MFVHICFVRMCVNFPNFLQITDETSVLKIDQRKMSKKHVYTVGNANHNASQRCQTTDFSQFETFSLAENVNLLLLIVCCYNRGAFSAYTDINISR